MSTENKPDEKELWKKIPASVGTERAETFIELSHLAYDRGDHKAALALCQSAREIYESQSLFVETSRILHVYEGITWSLRKLDRDAEAAQVALDAAELLKDEDAAASIEMLRDAGRFYYAADEYEKSLECHTRALENVDPDLSDLTNGIDYFNVGVAYVQLARYPEALAALQSARSYFKKEREPERVFYCDEYITVCFIELGNSVEAMRHAQKSLDFAITAQKTLLETWARYRMGCTKILIGEADEAEEELRRALSMNAHACHTDWDLAILLEKEIAKLLVSKGRVAESDEILRRIANLEEIMDDEA